MLFRSKIFLLFSAAMSVLALYCVYKHCSFKAEPLTPPPSIKDPISPIAKISPVVTEVSKGSPIPPLLWDSKKHFSFDPKLPPEKYRSVLGSKKTKKFLEAEKDLSIVAELAKYARTMGTMFGREGGELMIRDLIDHASLEQTEVIVKAVADDIGKVRTIFKDLFSKMEDPIHLDDGKQKVEIALEALSHTQLMNILAVHNDNDYQMELRRIRQIPISDFLKWQTELGLSQDFIEACTQLDEYAQHIESKANKEREKGRRIVF